MSAMDVNDASAAMDTESPADGRPAGDAGFRPMNPGQGRRRRVDTGSAGQPRGGGRSGWGRWLSQYTYMGAGDQMVFWGNSLSCVEKGG